MARANDNRQPVGKMDCDDCATVAALFQVASGKRKGYLYKRCACGCDQSSGHAKQRKWLRSMTRTDADMYPHPLADDTEAEPAPEPKQPDPEPAPEPDQEPGGEPNRGRSFVGLAALVGAVALALVK